MKTLVTEKRVVLAGGSGFLGRMLAPALRARGYEVVILTRHPRSKSGPDREVLWDGRTAGAWQRELEGALAVVNLTGKNVSCRYTLANRREIDASRVDSVRAIETAIARCDRPPRVWVQTASLAIYGDAGDRWCDETAPPGEGFPVETCLLWEAAFNAVRVPRTRRVLLRVGFALGTDGGALAILARLVRLFLGGAAGNGRQYISWIHRADLVAMFLAAIEDERFAGVYNAVTPHPVTNAQFMNALRRALHRPWSPPVPVWAVHVGSWFMRTEACLALTGRRGTPRRFLEAGFPFRFPELEPALADLYG